MANISYIKLLQAVELFSSEHMQVRRFASDFPSQMPNFGTEQEKYPIIFVSPVTNIFDRNVNTFTVDIYCFDIIQKDRLNINTILSDTNLILSDLHRWMLDGKVYGIDISVQVTTTPIDNALLDYAAGWKMTCEFTIDTYGVCEIPFVNVPIISMEVNNVVYSSALTCDSLADCTTFTGAIDNLQNQIDNLPTGNPIVSGFFSPDDNTLTLVDSIGGQVVINNEINIITHTRSEMLEHIAAGNLVPGVVYKITNVDLGLYSIGSDHRGTTVFLLALQSDKLDTYGTGIFFNPKYIDDDGFGIWNSNNSYNYNDIAIWGGCVWENQSSSVGNSLGQYELNPEDWKVRRYNSEDYNVVYDKIKYDILDDRIIYRNEKNLNEVSFDNEELSILQNETFDYCPIKAFQWGNPYRYLASKDRYIGIGNQKIHNSYISNINFTGYLQLNLTLTNTSFMYDIVAVGSVIFNNIILNSSSITGLDISNSNLSSYTLNNNSFITNCTITNADNHNMLYDNYSGQSNTNNFDGSQFYVQQNITVKNTTITHLADDQIDRFFLGDLPNVATSTVIGKSGNELVQTSLGDYALASNVHNIPPGGSTGQYLAKSTSSDYDVSWATYSAPSTPNLQNVTLAGNVTNQGIQLQPTVNTGTGSKYGLMSNSQFYLTSQSEGTTTVTFDKITWNRFGNNVSLSAYVASGSNSADFIFPTKTYAGSPYTLATTADITNFVPYTGAGQNVNLGLRSIYAYNFFAGFLSATASATLITMTLNTVPNYYITGTAGQTIKLPVATTLQNGTEYTFNNNQSSGAILVNNNSSTLVKSVPSGAYMTLQLVDNSTATGIWDAHFQLPSNASWSTNTLDWTGSIVNATWNGNVVALNRGGSNANLTANAGAVIYSTTASMALTGVGTVGQVLTSGGTASPTWQTLTFSTITTALGFTPYNSTNPTGYVTASIVDGYLTSASASATYQPITNVLTFKQIQRIGFLKI
jgi:hypothetical protein